jgi:hypothetical protein
MANNFKLRFVHASPSGDAVDVYITAAKPTTSVITLRERMPDEKTGWEIDDSNVTGPT